MGCLSRENLIFVILMHRKYRNYRRRNTSQKNEAQNIFRELSKPRTSRPTCITRNSLQAPT